MAKNYQWDRWINKTTGKGFNTPDPPKNAKREYYARLEEEQKERNKLAYQKRHGLSELNTFNTLSAVMILRRGGLVIHYQSSIF